MTDTAPEATPAEPPATTAASPKKGKPRKKAAASPKPKNVKPTNPEGEKKAPAHLPTAQLVNEAIGKLNERGGSSLQAIKKSIADSHKIDLGKLAPFIRKYLKSAVEKGSLIQTKGKGASGSFKLPQKEKKTKPAVEKPELPKAEEAVKVKKPADAKKAAKPESPKKPTAVQKAAKAKAPVKPKAPTASKEEKPKVAPKAQAVKAPVAQKKAKAASKPKAAAPKKPKAPAKLKAVKRIKKAPTVPLSK